jgi:hypothetical protein
MRPGAAMRRAASLFSGGGNHSAIAPLRTRSLDELADPIKTDPANRGAIAKEVRALEDGLARARIHEEPGATRHEPARARGVFQASISRIEPQEILYLYTFRGCAESLNSKPPAF